MAILTQQYKGFLTEIENSCTASLENRWFAADFFNKVIYNWRGSGLRYWVPGYSAKLLVPGLPTADLYDGVAEFGGQVITWDGNRLKWSEVNDFSMWLPVSQTAATGRLAVKTAFVQPAPGGVVRVETDGLATAWPKGLYVRIDLNVGSEAERFNFYDLAEAAVLNQTFLLLRRLDVTGGTTTGGTVGAQSSIVAVEANSAGEVINAGNKINGDIWNFIQLGEYAYLLKNKSFQSVQNVGRFAGTFAIRPEITDEGLLTPYTFCRFEIGTMFFLGSREFYKYSGGRTLEAVANQATRDFFRELDRNLLARIAFHHNERANEVWVIYVKKGSSTPRVLVYNYLEDSVTLDDYPTRLDLQTASLVDWDLALAWTDLPTSLTWGNASGSWTDFGIDISRQVTLLSATDASSALHGETGGLTILNGGSGYGVTAPTVGFIGGAGSGAAATATVAAGVVNALALTNNGSGYAQAPLVQFTQSGVTGALAKVILSGTGVGSIEVLDGGSGYGVAPTVSFIGGAGAGATATAVISGGKVTAVNVTAAGTGYTSAPLVAFTSGGVRHALASAGLVGDLVAVKVPRLFVHGRVFSRAGLSDLAADGYTALWETVDFDFGDALAWKYVDCIYASLEIEPFDNDALVPPNYLYLQVGGRENLDTPVNWSTAQALEVTGGGAPITKYNIRQSGRYIRLRFYSTGKNIRWRLAGFKIMGRMGNTY